MKSGEQVAFLRNENKTSRCYLGASRTFLFVCCLVCRTVLCSTTQTSVCVCLKNSSLFSRNCSSNFYRNMNHLWLISGDINIDSVSVLHPYIKMYAMHTMHCAIWIIWYDAQWWLVTAVMLIALFAKHYSLSYRRRIVSTERYICFIFCFYQLIKT